MYASLIINIENGHTSSLLVQPAKNVGSVIGSDKYDCSRFCRNPVGGSFVILTLFCNTVTGNYDKSSFVNASDVRHI